jgi:putative transposase
MQCKIDPSKSLEDIPRKQKQSPPRPLSFYANRYVVRDEATAYAYLSGHYNKLTEVGNWFGVSYATVSRALKSVECKM